MVERIPDGTVLRLEDGTRVRVGPFIRAADCYRVSYDGPGMIAGARWLEDLWRSTPSDVLKQLREEGIYA